MSDIPEELGNYVSHSARSQQEHITSLQAEVQHLQSQLTARDAVFRYQHDLLDKTQSELVETRVKLLQAIQFAQPTSVRDVAVSTVADAIYKWIEENKTKKTEENTEGWLRILHPHKGKESTLKVMVDMGATVNAITSGMIIDHELENQKIRLKEPHVLNLAVGTFKCSEQISIGWMGKGTEHGTSTFYVLRPGQANLPDRAILSKDEWLDRRCLLYEKDPISSNK
ncbi:hypothetical protein F5883DRAFT_229950 [Diaporthe sp. PMI_573]|nr:hypothetical protein F5883DRAFT_229950 [Diaporthaceae sp. PMI_573]